MANTITHKQLNLRFTPHILARNRHFQTIVSSLVKVKAPRLLAAAREMILEVDDGVRLQGFYSAQPQQPAKGVVLLLHGWLGHANTNYVLAMGEHLYRLGYSIFRLNFRDHGGSYLLNPGIFRSDRLAEVFAAAGQIAALAPESPLHIIGASLGGNFALRLAWQHSQTPIANLGHTLAICPALDPYHTTLQLDRSRLYLGYFRRKWRKACRLKQDAFPGKYDFSKVLAAGSCLEMTDTFIRHYSPYPDAMAYFERYAVTPAMMAALTSPVTMVTAVDDPVVPVSDFAAFQDISPWLHLTIQPYGGHVGFIDLFPYRHWLNEAAAAVLDVLS